MTNKEKLDLYRKELVDCGYQRLVTSIDNQITIIECPWKASIFYRELYCVLGGIYANQPTLCDNEGFCIEKRIQEETVYKMYNALVEAGIKDIDNQMGFICQATKGHENPTIIHKLLQRVLYQEQR